MDFRKLNAKRLKQAEIARRADVPGGTECYVRGGRIAGRDPDGRVWMISYFGGYSAREYIDPNSDAVLGIAEGRSPDDPGAVSTIRSWISNTMLSPHRVQWGRGKARAKVVLPVELEPIAAKR